MSKGIEETWSTLQVLLLHNVTEIVISNIGLGMGDTYRTSDKIR